MTGVPYVSVKILMKKNGTLSHFHSWWAIKFIKLAISVNMQIPVQFNKHMLNTFHCDRVPEAGWVEADLRPQGAHKSIATTDVHGQQKEPLRGGPCWTPTDRRALSRGRGRGGEGRGKQQHAVFSPWLNPTWKDAAQWLVLQTSNLALKIKYKAPSLVAGFKFWSAFCLHISYFLSLNCLKLLQINDMDNKPASIFSHFTITEMGIHHTIDHL